MKEKMLRVLGDIGIPVLYMARPKVFPSISFQFFSRGGILYGDGESVEKGGGCHIDIWSQDDKINEILNKIESEIFAKFRSNVVRDDYYESDVKIYHTVLKFIFLEDENGKKQEDEQD